MHMNILLRLLIYSSYFYTVIDLLVIVYFTTFFQLFRCGSPLPFPGIPQCRVKLGSLSKIDPMTHFHIAVVFDILLIESIDICENAWLAFIFQCNIQDGGRETEVITA